MRKQATDIKADLGEGTRLALKNKVKKVSKEYHIHEAIKADMNQIFERKPLIIRHEFKIPIYPMRKDPNSTSKSETSKDAKQTSGLFGFRNFFDGIKITTANDLNNESRDGLVTETQLEIVSGHVASIDNNRPSD